MTVDGRVVFKRRGSETRSLKREKKPCLERHAAVLWILGRQTDTWPADVLVFALSS